MAGSPQEGVLWQRAQLAGIAMVSIFVLQFIAQYSGMVKRLWNGFFTVFFAVAAGLQLLNPGKLMWLAGDPIVKEIGLPWGRMVTYHEVAPGILTQVTGVMGITLIIYVLVVAYRYGRAGNRRRALPLLAACVIILLSIANDIGVMSGEHKFIYTMEYGYMALVLLMTFSMARQVMQAAGMKDALEKSQSEIFELNQNLEQMVEERTGELMESNEMLKIEIEVRSAVEEKLKDALEKIKTMSITDVLTDCYNRAYLIEHLPHEIRRASRYRYPFSVIMRDIDHFKRINDSYGHQAGDEVLRGVVHRVEEIIRDNVDWVARYGGEEFVLALPHTDLPGGICLAERLRRAISELKISYGEQLIRVTASFGVVCFNPLEGESDISPEQLINAADSRMYAAKEAGRNCVRPAID